MTYPAPQFDPAYPAFSVRHGLEDWEGWWSAYDEATYQSVLGCIHADDAVLEIGAGDLRLSLRLAERARCVVVVEVNPIVLGKALARIGYDLPRSLHVVCANALDYPCPAGMSVAVLLMRHCRHFATYAARLEVGGCRRLITNARWGMGVEEIDFGAACDWDAFEGGWYACLCGRVGFEGKVASADGMAEAVTVRSCPACCALPRDSGL